MHSLLIAQDASWASSMWDWMPPALCFLGVFLLAILVLGERREARRFRAEQQQAAQERHSHVAREVESANQQLVENAQRVAADLEDRAERLAALLAAAQKRIGMLEELLDQTGRHEDLLDIARDAPLHAHAIESEQFEGAMPASVDAEVDEDRVPEIEVTVRDHKKQRLRELAMPDPLTPEVYRLADAGRSPIEIAQSLDEQVGKIELILALRGL